MALCPYQIWCLTSLALAPGRGATTSVSLWMTRTGSLSSWLRSGPCLAAVAAGAGPHLRVVRADEEERMILAGAEYEQSQ